MSTEDNSEAWPGGFWPSSDDRKAWGVEPKREQEHADAVAAERARRRMPDGKR